MPIELIVAGVLAGIVAVVFLLKKREDKLEAPPPPVAVPVKSWGSAGFDPALDYIAWQKRNNFPVSVGEPTPRPVALVDMIDVFENVMSEMTYVYDDGNEDYTLDPPMIAGDCEDFAIMFRLRLMKKGVPLDCMRMVHVRTETGGWHAVLGVWSLSGLYTLDQRKGAPWPYASGGYLEGHFEAGDVWGALQ